jgi:hypothetical protein
MRGGLTTAAQDSLPTPSGRRPLLFPNGDNDLGNGTGLQLRLDG